MKESGITCGSHVQLTCSILKKSQFTVISPTICFIWWNATYPAVLCSCMWIVHIKLCTVGLQWHKMNRKCPEHASSSLLTTAAEEKQNFHRLLFLCLFGLFTPSYECICDRFHQRQCCDSRAGIFKWNFNHFLLETVWNVKESGVTCGSHTWLTCSILCKIYTGFKLVSLKSLNSQQFPQQSVSSNEMPHLMQFSEAALEPCMVHCVLLDCNGTKWTGNALTNPPAACSQQLLRRNKLPTGWYFFACLVFSPHDMKLFVTD